MINVVTWLDSNKYRNEISAVCAGNGIRIVADEFKDAYRQVEYFADIVKRMAEDAWRFL